MWSRLGKVFQARWGDARWGDARWGDARWGDARWGDARWGDARWGDAHWAMHTKAKIAVSQVTSLFLYLLTQ